MITFGQMCNFEDNNYLLMMLISVDLFLILIVCLIWGLSFIPNLNWTY